MESGLGLALLTLYEYSYYIPIRIVSYQSGQISQKKHLALNATFWNHATSCGFAPILSLQGRMVLMSHVHVRVIPPRETMTPSCSPRLFFDLLNPTGKS